MEENFVCRWKKCPDNLSGRIFPTSRGFVGHYRISHGDTEEGRRQVRLQRKQAEAEAASGVIVHHVTEVVEPETGAFDETGEPYPYPSPDMGESARASVGEIESYLEHHVSGLTRELESTKQRASDIQLEVEKLEELLKRATAALEAYKTTSRVMKQVL